MLVGASLRFCWVTKPATRKHTLIHRHAYQHLMHYCFCCVYCVRGVRRFIMHIVSSAFCGAVGVVWLALGITDNIGVFE
jgi:hypothetical protein